MSRRGESSTPSTGGWVSRDSEEVSRRKSTPRNLQAEDNTATNGKGDRPHSAPLPGRPRRRPIKPLQPFRVPKKKKSTFWHRFYVKWIQGASNATALVVAVALWYLLGVVSIGTSKLLLMEESPHSFTHLIGNVPPLFLTLQQLGLGMCTLRLLLHFKAFQSPGLQPWPGSHVKVSKLSHRSRKHNPQEGWFQKSPSTDLTLAGLFFGAGFWATNCCFQHSSAAFVETIKAAEPITSATVAVMWGIEFLGPQEVLSLCAVVMGCLFSTLGHSDGVNGTMSMADSFKSSSLVMVANLCFSFRGLYQKLFRASPHGTSSVVDDLNLQFRMQQVGVTVLLIPVLIWDIPGLVARIWTLSQTHGLIQSGVLGRYLQLSLVNGLAFANYNLASTFVLTRISVVHHAALNCIRRIFAIVVTSIAFGIPITWMGSFGITISFGGFLSFTHFKAKRLRQPRPLSSLLPMSSQTSDEFAN